jgi:hypothetical protein
MRAASSGLDEATDWLARRLGTYDEQDGEAEAHSRVRDASQRLKLRLATHVLDSVANETR